MKLDKLTIWTISYLKIFIALLLLTIFYSANAGSSDNFQKRDYIHNDIGDKCWYTQETDFESLYFHEAIKGKMGIITFDDPGCMSESVLGLDINKMMINNAIIRWYSHRDAAFKTSTRKLFPSSTMQKKGLCIQSSKYPIVGVMVDYEIKDNSIIRVRHEAAIQGCGT